MEAGDWLRPPLEVNSPEGKIKDSGLALSFYIYCKVLLLFLSLQFWIFCLHNKIKTIYIHVVHGATFQAKSSLMIPHNSIWKILLQFLQKSQILCWNITEPHKWDFPFLAVWVFEMRLPCSDSEKIDLPVIITSFQSRTFAGLHQRGKGITVTNATDMFTVQSEQQWH